MEASGGSGEASKMALVGKGDSDSSRSLAPASGDDTLRDCEEADAEIILSIVGIKIFSAALTEPLAVPALRVRWPRPESILDATLCLGAPGAALAALPGAGDALPPRAGVVEEDPLREVGREDTLALAPALDFGLGVAVDASSA
jgi:hypothetical protein